MPRQPWLLTEALHLTKCESSTTAGKGSAGFTASTSLFPTKEKHFIKKACRLLAFYVGQNLCKRFHMVRVIAGNSSKSSNQRKTTRIPSPLSSPYPLSENPGSLFLFWKITFGKQWKLSKLAPRFCLRGNSNPAVFMGYLSLHQYLIPEVNGSDCYYPPYLLWQSLVVIQI